MASSSASTESVPKLSRSEAKSALNEVIRAMSEPKNSHKMSAARLVSDRTNSESDGQQPSPHMEAVRHLQFVFPIATQILMDVISNYGFSKSGEGVVQFTLAVRHMERFDEDIKRLYTQMKAYFLPTLPSSAKKSSIV